MIRFTDRLVAKLFHHGSRTLAPALIAALLFALAGCGGKKDESGPLVLRVGHFPNITHAQGLIAHHLSRQGQGWFESRLGREVEIQWFVYNAGPTAMEGLLNGSLDLTYVGPNPALNAHIRSGGDEVRVVAGAARGGAALVVREDSGILRPEDFRHRKIATPQFGNTQDVACRAWLAAHGFHVTPTGGDVSVLPTANPDQLTLFLRKEIDAAWTVEPWVSKLELQGSGKVFVEQDDALTTVLTSSARILKEKPELVARFVRAHAELTAWIVEHPEEARRMVQEELLEETRGRLPDPVVQRAWGRLHFTDQITVSEFESFVEAAQQAGFMDEAVDLSRLVRIP